MTLTRTNVNPRPACTAARALKETQGEMQGRITELEAAIKQAQEGKANDRQELEMVVQMHNAKYNEMMAQQLAEQDKLSVALREAEIGRASCRERV